MSRGGAVAAALVIVLLSASLGGVALAVDTAAASPMQQNNSTTPAETDTEQASSWSPPGPFDLETLKQGGVKSADAPPSARMLEQPAEGSMAVRWTPPSPLKNEQQLLESGQRVETDTIELWSTWFGEETGDYQVVIVSWQEETKRVDGTEQTYAANQEVQRVDVELENGYATTPIELQSHYDEPYQMTMWLERPGGDVVQGARWRFEHRSNPLTAAPGTSVDSLGDLWRWGAMFILLPALAGLFVARRTARHFIDRTITSPRKGTAWWGFVLLFGAFALISVAMWQTAAVLARAPYVAGVFMFFASLVVMLGLRDNDLETAEFNRKDLKTVTALHDNDDEGRKQARHEDIRLRKIVRRAGKVYLPAKGIRPFLARYWAQPAQVDESDLNTVNRTDGDVSIKYEIDPDSEETLTHTPAHLAFDPTLIHGRDADAPTPNGTVDKLEDLLGRVNTRFLAVAIGGGAVVYAGVMAAISVPSIAAMLALLPALAAGTKARDGSLTIEPAPYHFASARANLVSERATYKEARTFEDLHKLVAELDLDTIEQTQEMTQAVQKQLTNRINEMFAVPDLGDGDKSELGGDGDGDGGAPAWKSPEPEPEAGVSDD